MAPSKDDVDLAYNVATVAERLSKAAQQLNEAGCAAELIDPIGKDVRAIAQQARELVGRPRPTEGEASSE